MTNDERLSKIQERAYILSLMYPDRDAVANWLESEREIETTFGWGQKLSIAETAEQSEEAATPDAQDDDTKSKSAQA